LLTELPRVHHLLAGGGDHGGGHGVGEEAIIGGTEDPWGDDPPLRDVSVIEARLVGAVVPDLDDGLAFGLSFPPDRRAERAANAYLGDLAGTFARPLTLRSYGYDILRWLRFLAAVEVSFDAVVRGDYLDFRRWLVARGKTGGARRPRAEPAAAGRVNPVTGKRAPHEREFGPATIRHSRVVLFDWYEFLYERGGRPLVNPIPARRWSRPFGATGAGSIRLIPGTRRGISTTTSSRRCGRCWAVTGTGRWPSPPWTAGSARGS
jgi:hypothetical protein